MIQLSLEHSRPTQANRVLVELMAHPEGVMTYEFFRLSPPIMRAASRVHELKKMGYQIHTKYIRKGNYKYILETA